MPTNTDLVKDLPADFEVFGQAVDTDFADLKGGTTGQVLSKTSGTDLDFTWITPSTSPLTTKGDLYGYSTADARIPVGSNGTVLTADSTESLGVKWATPSAPSFSGAVVSGGNLSTLAHDTLTTINFSTDVIDTDAYHDTSTNTSRITIPTGKSGKFLVYSFGYRMANFTNSDGYIQIHKNGSGVITGYPGFSPSNGRPTWIVFGILDLVATDYLEVKVYQASGSTQTVISNGQFAAQFLGA
jgi:hypothetical protein